MLLRNTSDKEYAMRLKVANCYHKKSKYIWIYLSGGEISSELQQKIFLALFLHVSGHHLHCFYGGPWRGAKPLRKGRPPLQNVPT